MPMNRREFIAASAAGAALLPHGIRAFAATGGNIQVAIDASQSSQPIDPMIFGGYMEPATTSVWAEMLTDRKFAKPVVPAKAEPAKKASFIFFRGEPFRPVGPEDSVVMDAVKPFVGKHSPHIHSSAAEPRGIRQAKLHVAGGKAYVGRVILAGDPGVKVVVRLVWGTDAASAQSIAIPALTREYKSFPFRFTPSAASEDAHLEILGTGGGSFHVGAASLMPADNVKGFRPGMIRIFKEEGFKMMKWPGGNFVSAYDFRDGLGDRDKRPPRLQAMWSDSVESNDVGLHEFMDLCKLVGAEPDLAINSGFGSAREAAEEVEYCNSPATTRMGRMRAENGHPEPFKIRFWTIGNEMYGPWQYGHMSADQYWDKHNAIVDAMRAVDPSILVTLSGATVCEKGVDAAEKKANFFPSNWEPPIPDNLPFEFGSTSDWDGWLLDKCKDHTNFVSEHTYAYPELIYDAQKQSFVDVKDPLEYRTRRLANRIGGAFDALDKYYERIPGLKEKNIKFVFDEWGNRVRSMSPTDTGYFMRNTGMLVPLSYALCLHEIFRHSDRVSATCATGGLFVQTGKSGDATGMSSDGVVMKLIQTHFGKALPVAVTGNSPQPLMPGTAFVDRGVKPTGSPTFPLDVFAALSADRKTLLVSIVNPTEQSHGLTQTIGGVRLSGRGKLSQIAPSHFDASNKADKEPEVTIVETAQDTVPQNIQAPPFSISLYEFAIA